MVMSVIVGASPTRVAVECCARSSAASKAWTATTAIPAPARSDKLRSARE